MLTLSLKFRSLIVAFIGAIATIFASGLPLIWGANYKISFIPIGPNELFSTDQTFSDTSIIIAGRSYKALYYCEIHIRNIGNRPIEASEMGPSFVFDLRKYNVVASEISSKSKDFNPTIKTIDGFLKFEPFLFNQGAWGTLRIVFSDNLECPPSHFTFKHISEENIVDNYNKFYNNPGNLNYWTYSYERNVNRYLKYFVEIFSVMLIIYSVFIIAFKSKDQFVIFEKFVSNKVSYYFIILILLIFLWREFASLISSTYSIFFGGAAGGDGGAG